MIVKILAREDRKIVAGILVDNGYAVSQCKVKRLTADGKPTRNYDYALNFEEKKGVVDNEDSIHD